MSAHAARAPARGFADAAARADTIERALSRFRPEVTARVRSTAARHPWIADLAVSFPALLFALAFPRKPNDGIALATLGAPLAAVAKEAAVPLWLRDFPARAFLTPIPVLPDTHEFRRRIGNHPPRRWTAAPHWLDSVSLAATWSTGAVALWFAREAPLHVGRRRFSYRKTRDLRRLVALWAWFSEHPDTLAGSLIKTRWNAEMKWKNATNPAYHWSDNVATRVAMGGREIDDVWAEPGDMDGYTFVPLRSASELAEESAAMENCVRTYGGDVADNYRRVWSMRRDGERVATLELSMAFPSAPYPHISELSARGNKPAPPEVWLAARRWLHANDKPGADPKRFEVSLTERRDRAAWRAMWRPYWLAKRRIPSWLPLAPVAMYAI
jgi:hypothetical protein